MSRAAPIGPVPPEIAQACEGRALVRHIAHFTATASTQLEARRLAARRGAGVLVVADAQHAGRGRLGRGWHSPAGGGLWMSLVLAPRRPLPEWPCVTSLAALALREALRHAAGLSCGIKWPNDLLIRGRKIAGILAETATGEPLILGIGVNLDQTASDFPEELRALATSARIESQTAHDASAHDTLASQDPAAASSRLPERAELLAAWLRAFEPRFVRFEADGPAPFLDELRAASLLIGRRVEIVPCLSDDAGAQGAAGERAYADDQGALARGRVVDLGACGQLVLEIEGDRPGRPARREITGGEIRSIMPPLR
jgi:BirA family biotin operon repressor/biotin-[acetyl-CoA-carboxylase] ligase